MKKKMLIVLTAFILAAAMILPSCSRDEKDCRESTSNPPTASSEKTPKTETEPANGTEPTDETEPPDNEELHEPDYAAIFEENIFEEYCEGSYFAYNITRNYFISDIVGKEKCTYYDSNIFEAHKFIFQPNQYPLLYLRIKEFGVKKEDFIKCNEKYKEINKTRTKDYYEILTDEQIDILFDCTDIRLIRKGLKSSTVFYYEGVLFRLFEVMELPFETQKKMADDGELREYLAEMAYLLWKNNYENFDEYNAVINLLEELEKYRYDYDPGLKNYFYHYQSNLCDLAILYEFTEDAKATDYIWDEFPEHRHEFKSQQLPPIYQAIKKFKITKEDFIRVNEEHKAHNLEDRKYWEPREIEYTDRQIELLFDEKDINVIKQELKTDGTYYYDGVLYNLYQVMDLSLATQKKMAKNGGLVEYLESMAKYFDKHGNDYWNNAVTDLISKLK